MDKSVLVDFAFSVVKTDSSRFIYMVVIGARLSKIFFLVANFVSGALYCSCLFIDLWKARINFS